MRRYFTEVEDNFLRDNISSAYTLYDLLEKFNANFPEHHIKLSNMQKRLQKLGIKKGTHNVRKEKIRHINSIGTVICNKDGKKARVKTENGYVHADTYFKELYYNCKDNKMLLIHLNGDYSDYSYNNLELVDISVHRALHWRKWIFKDPEITKAAILTVKLLSYFPELVHNENQYYRNSRILEN